MENELEIKPYADLFGADLSGANLSGADLSGANLFGAKDGQKKIIDIEQGPTRSRKYQFVLFIYNDNSHLIKAGCRNLDISKFYKHAKTYTCETKKAKTFAILKYFEKILEIRNGK